MVGKLALNVRQRSGDKSQPTRVHELCLHQSGPTRSWPQPARMSRGQVGRGLRGKNEEGGVTTGMREHQELLLPRNRQS